MNHTYIFTSDEMLTQDWSKWENHVLAELKRLNGNIEKAILDQSTFKDQVVKEQADFKSEIAVIKTKVAIFASGFGFVGSLVVPLFQMLLDYFGKKH